MFCPGCGSKNSTEQRFCRSCGINLEPVAESLFGQVPASGSDDLAKRERILERFGQFAFGGFGIVLLIAIAGIIYTILTRMVFSGQQPWVGLVLTAFILFAGLTLAYVGFSEDLKERRRKGRHLLDPQSSISEFENPIPTAKLLEESQFQPVSSIVENTTKLLPTPDHKQ